jgi:hypothetical protein
MGSRQGNLRGRRRLPTRQDPGKRAADAAGVVHEPLAREHVARSFGPFAEQPPLSSSSRSAGHEAASACSVS